MLRARVFVAAWLRHRDMAWAADIHPSDLPAKEKYVMNRIGCLAAVGGCRVRRKLHGYRRLWRRAIVFDPNNYAQNVLSGRSRAAADQTIRSRRYRNQTQMLINQAKNLAEPALFVR